MVVRSPGRSVGLARLAAAGWFVVVVVVDARMWLFVFVVGLLDLVVWLFGWSVGWLVGFRFIGWLAVRSFACCWFAVVCYCNAVPLSV